MAGIAEITWEPNTGRIRKYLLKDVIIAHQFLLKLRKFNNRIKIKQSNIKS